MQLKDKSEDLSLLARRLIFGHQRGIMFRDKTLKLTQNMKIYDSEQEASEGNLNVMCCLFQENETMRAALF